MIHFPVYALRPYHLLFEENEYKVVQTAKSRFILDFVDKELVQSSYSKRRILLLGLDLPYKLYPLNKKIDTLSGIVSNKYRNFIDAKGNLIRWKPTKFHKIICKLITYREITSDGSMLLKVQGYETVFKSYPTEASYARVVRFKNVDIIYDFTDTKIPNTRRKL
jgi:hypothetical protein